MMLLKRNKLLCVPLFIIGIFYTFCAILLAEQENSHSEKYMFYNANNFYKQAEYAKAIKQYEQILERGSESGNLYYNLANSYLKEGAFGKAILNYERAGKMIPRDKDLESNYQYARSLMTNSVAGPKIPWLKKLVDKFYGQFTLNEMTVLLSVIYTLIFLILAMRIFLKSPRLRSYSLISVFILVSFFIASSFSFHKRISALGREAIVVVKEAEAKFGPFNRATTYFTLYEGTKIYVLLAKDDWNKIKRADKKVGWIKKSSLKVI